MAGTLKGHEAVNHNVGEYVRGEVSTNKAEGYFSHLKRSLDGTYHHVSVRHLPRYLAQFDWLYSLRPIPTVSGTSGAGPAARRRQRERQVGHRLPAALGLAGRQSVADG